MTMTIPAVYCKFLSSGLASLNVLSTIDGIREPQNFTEDNNILVLGRQGICKRLYSKVRRVAGTGFRVSQLHRPLLPKVCHIFAFEELVREAPYDFFDIDF